MHVTFLEVIVRIGLVVATTFLFSIVSLTYYRIRSRKMLFIFTGFAIFFVHALITLPELISDDYILALDENGHLLIHLIALVFILLGILKD